MNKNVSIVIIIILVAISVVFYAYYYVNRDLGEEENPGNNGNEGETPTEPVVIDYDMLVIDNISNWGYVDGRWRTLDIDEIEDNEFVVYVNHQYYGNYNLKYGTIWNLFDDNNSYVEYYGDLIAYSNDFNVVIPSYAVTNVTGVEISEITTILGHGFNSSTLSTNEVVNIDLDSNGIVDKIVNVSNLDSLEEEQYYFNLCYVVLNNEIQVVIDDEVQYREIMSYPVYKLNYILRYDNNSVFSFILQEGYFSNVGETQNNLYDYVDGTYIRSFSD